MFRLLNSKKNYKKSTKYYFTNVLECWSVGVLECWSVGVLVKYTINKRIFTIITAINFFIYS